MSREKHMLRHKGFSLVELAVVFLIVSLLIGGMLLPLAAQQDVSSRLTTEKSLSDIREALIGFAIVNGRLPCPADRAIATGSANAGTEVTTGTGSALTCACGAGPTLVATSGAVACGNTGPVTGVVPWATLGLAETNYWGQRFTYTVTARFARGATGQTDFGACTPTTNPTSAAFALCSSGDITVSTAAAGGTSLASTLPAIVVSHGKNVIGAWLTGGTKSTLTAAGDELENSNDDGAFVSNTTIDDQLIWIPGSTLMARMLAAGKLP